LLTLLKIDINSELDGEPKQYRFYTVEIVWISGFVGSAGIAGDVGLEATSNFVWDFICFDDSIARNVSARG
jgi:hypothetical protein